MWDRMYCTGLIPRLRYSCSSTSSPGPSAWEAPDEWLWCRLNCRALWLVESGTSQAEGPGDEVGRATGGGWNVIMWWYHHTSFAFFYFICFNFFIWRTLITAQPSYATRVNTVVCRLDRVQIYTISKIWLKLSCKVLQKENYSVFGFQ